jgi:hypothetical protein
MSHPLFFAAIATASHRVYRNSDLSKRVLLVAQSGNPTDLIPTQSVPELKLDKTPLSGGKPFQQVWNIQHIANMISLPAKILLHPGVANFPLDSSLVASQEYDHPGLRRPAGHAQVVDLSLRDDGQPRFLP